MKSARRTKKSKNKNQRTKFRISALLFVLAKKIKNNFIAYYLLLTKASPRKLQPYYHTFIYTLIRQTAWLIISLKRAAARFNFPRLKRGQFMSFWPRITKRGISATVIIAVIFTQVVNVGAFEAHVVNVTATVVNDIPAADPAGGQYCTASTTPVNLTTSLIDPAAEIIYTTDGSDPVCVSNGIIYNGPITIATATTLKASTCHDGKQSAINTWIYNFENCDNNLPPPQAETCDGADNDLNGTIDDVYVQKLATSTANLTRLDDLTNVTASTTASDDIYATETASGSETKYIYLNWVWPQIATSSAIASSTLYLEHREDNASTSVEWWNGSSFEQVCNPPESGSDAVDSCNLNSFITSASLARNVALRLVINSLTGTATENLDWAELDMEYTEPINCDLLSCGNGTTDANETCDDGNQLNQDGCDSSCQIEPAYSCVKINEVYYDVDSSHGSEGDNEWVELYNACNFVAKIENWTIKDGTSTTTITQNLNLASHGFAVLSPASTTWAFWNIPAEAEKIELGSNLGNGLGNNGDQLILKDNNGVIADQMSYGTNINVFDLPESPSASAEGRSIARIVKGIDTDMAADWAYLANPNPGTNPHPTNPLEATDSNLIINQTHNNLAQTGNDDGQGPLNSAATDLNNNGQPVIEPPTASSTTESASGEQNTGPNQPVEENNGRTVTPPEPEITEPNSDEIISDGQQIIEPSEETVETTEIVELINSAENNGSNNISAQADQPQADNNIPVNPVEETPALPEPVIIEPPEEPSPIDEAPAIIEIPQEPAIEPSTMPTEATPNSETTIL